MFLIIKKETKADNAYSVMGFKYTKPEAEKACNALKVSNKKYLYEIKEVK